MLHTNFILDVGGAFQAPLLIYETTEAVLFGNFVDLSDRKSSVNVLTRLASGSQLICSVCLKLLLIALWLDDRHQHRTRLSEDFHLTLVAESFSLLLKRWV